MASGHEREHAGEEDSNWLGWCTVVETIAARLDEVRGMDSANTASRIVGSTSAAR